MKHSIRASATVLACALTFGLSGIAQAQNNNAPEPMPVDHAMHVDAPHKAMPPKKIIKKRVIKKKVKIVKRYNPQPR